MNIFEKLCRIQNEIKAPKTEFNPFGNFKYRNAEGILQMVKPLCLQHETTLILTDSIEVIEGRFFVKTIAELVDWSIDGETAGKVVSMPGYAEFPSLKAKTDEAQRTGIASSYAKKRALEALFNLSSEKDSDAIPPDKEVEKQEAIQKNQEKMDAEENWRLLNGNVVMIKAGDGNFYELNRLSKRQLQSALMNEKFDGIRDFIEAEIAKK